MKTISIIGLGLIGGSLGMRLYPHHHILGHDLMKRSMEEAVERKAIHEALSFDDAVAKADLVILAAPLSKIPELVERAAPFLKPGAVLTDVGSTKSKICAAMRTHLKPGQFVGGHPMAGTEHRGIKNAQIDLFDEKTFALTPESPEEEEAAKKVKELFKAIPLTWVSLSADEHDLTVAYTSHLPYLMSVLIARASMGATKNLPHLREMMGSGFKDTTRLAGQNPTLGRDLCLSNNQNLQTAIAQLRYSLSQVEWLLENESRSALELLLEETAGWRTVLFEE